MATQRGVGSMRVRKLLPAAASLVLFLAVLAAPASAWVKPAEEATEAGAMAAGADSDAQEYAREHGLPIVQARERVAEQHELGPLKERVREVAGDRFARAATEHEEFFGL